MNRHALCCRPVRGAARSAALLILVVLVVGPLHGARPALAQVQSPASAGEAIRSALFAAQMAITGDPGASQSSLAAAQSSLAAALSEYAAIADELPAAVRSEIERRFDLAKTALAQGDEAGFAAARAQIWTRLLGGAALTVEQGVLAGDGARAAQWLPLREFRQATRFARPATGATMAVAGLQEGTIDAATALISVRADLWDAYQARLDQALYDLAAADRDGYALRRAEAAALAQGYFAILAPAYAEQRGQSAADAAGQEFAHLSAAAAQGEPVADLLPAVKQALDGFRAAPLSAGERNRRASQLLRYLPLVAVEYGRGVDGGRVTLDLEIREAITFADGAAAAFADLKDLLAEEDAQLTQSAAQQVLALRAALEATAARTSVAPASDIESQVDALRAQIASLIPDEWESHSSDADFDMVAAALDQMEQAVRGGQYELAESARLDAYATLESGPEARLTAFAPGFVPMIEGLFWQGYENSPGLAQLLTQRAPAQQIEATRAALDQHLAEAQEAIGGQMAPQAVASNAALIVFREGLEAVLILASLLASLRKGDQRRMRSPLWSGVLLALGVTVLTWFLAQGALTSLARYGEKLEAVVSLIAVAMLLLILNWFFHDIYWKDWMAGFHQRKQRIIRGSASQWIGLIVLGFTSVYREGFETVIFLQALVLEAGTRAVLIGVSAGLGLTILLGLAVFGLQARLPHKKMLVVTGVLIGAVLLQMVGNMAHTFQVVGWLPTHPIRWLSLPYWMGLWFGIYPTWEGIGLQALAAAFTIGSYVAAEKMAGHSVRLWPQRRPPQPTEPRSLHSGPPAAAAGSPPRGTTPQTEGSPARPL